MCLGTSLLHGKGMVIKMAKYCRYCGEKMSESRDCFCYKCRREGKPVDRFYRRIREEDKAPLIEEEQDLLRSEGKDAIACGIVIDFFALPFVILDFCARVIDPSIGTKLSAWLSIILILLVLFGGYIIFLGSQMLLLKRKVFRFKPNIRLYVSFIKLLEIRRKSEYLIPLITLPEAMKRADAISFLLEKFADGEGKETPEAKKKRGQENSQTWVCRFCGYENRKASFACKSCGKEKNTRLP